MKKTSYKKLKGKKGIALIVVIATLILGIDLSSSQVNILTNLIEGVISTFNETSQEYESGKVVRVVDGDTIVVHMNGEDKKVRLIGIDTPESVGKYLKNPELYGKASSTFAQEQLEGKRVFLEKDVSDTDRYGRLLRYVWLEQPNDETIDTQMFNVILLLKGYASILSISPDVKYSDYFLLCEEVAREKHIGIWGEKVEK